MDLSSASDVYTYCFENGLLTSAPETVSIQTLRGGVSSDVVHIRDRRTSFVLKRAVRKLRVHEDWYASTERNVTERYCLQRMHDLLPEFVPRVLWVDPDMGLFAMEYIVGHNWKMRLLDHEVDPQIARSCALFLATVHRTTYRDPLWLHPVSSKELFYQLRISPYFVFIRERFPDLSAQLDFVVENMMSVSDVLVHGDFSPKNILVRRGQPVILDWEVGHAGHPAFDIGFMLHHLLLKALYAGTAWSKYVSVGEQFYETYFKEVKVISELDYRSITLQTTGALMLARVDGKSKVEYLSEAMREAARGIGKLLLSESIKGIGEVASLVASSIGD